MLSSCLLLSSEDSKMLSDKLLSSEDSKMLSSYLLLSSEDSKMLSSEDSNYNLTLSVHYTWHMKNTTCTVKSSAGAILIGSLPH